MKPHALFKHNINKCGCRYQDEPALDSTSSSTGSERLVGRRSGKGWLRLVIGQEYQITILP